MRHLAVWARYKLGFREEDHPRDDHGRFAEGAGEGASGFRKAEPKEFRQAFAKAFEGSAFTNHVTHYTEKELEGMHCLLSHDGKTGVAVHDHGDGRIEATALFNNGGEKGSGLKILAHSIKTQGVNYVECYGPHLNKMYESLGFKEDSRSAFNREYAAAGWNYEKFDSPDYHTMRLS